MTAGKAKQYTDGRREPVGLDGKHVSWTAAGSKGVHPGRSSRQLQTGSVRSGSCYREKTLRSPFEREAGICRQRQ
jgi:hypothetical protein